MHKPDLRNERFEILMDLVERIDEAPHNGGYDLDEWIFRLEALERKKHHPFYAMLNQLDADTRLLQQAQGDPVETRAAIDRLVSHLMGHAEKMGEG